ncbi:hypothetical protein AYO38_05135 [bacterium SCGC AG-212-C10]|nr:hypothetical protein AYO38_05135 [bacterium SCGC AG-212-C10]
MKRRTLDFVFAGGGVLIALLLIALYLVLHNQAEFANDYVHDQLSEQRVTFTAAEKLKEEEKDWKPGSSCLVKNGGKPLTTGKQAECYANFYIALHLEQSAAGAGYPGETYGSIGAVQTELRTQLAAAKAANDGTAADLQTKLDAVTALRNSQFTGETLRGLLLTSYGFSVFGDRIALAADVCLLAAIVLLLLSVAGFIHALMTSKDERVLAPGANEARPS